MTYDLDFLETDNEKFFFNLHFVKPQELTA